MKKFVLLFIILLALTGETLSQTSPLSFGTGSVKANGNCYTVSIKLQIPPTQYPLAGGRDELVWRDQYGLHTYTLGSWQGAWFGNANYILPIAPNAIVQWAAVQRWYYWHPLPFGTVAKSTEKVGIKWCN